MFNRGFANVWLESTTAMPFRGILHVAFSRRGILKAFRAADRIRIFPIGGVNFKLYPSKIGSALCPRVRKSG